MTMDNEKEKGSSAVQDLVARLKKYKLYLQDLIAKLKKHKLYLETMETLGPRGERLDCYLEDLRGVDLRGADLRFAIFDKACARGVNFSGANLVAASLYGADLAGANLTGAIISYNTDLRGVLLGGNSSYVKLVGGECDVLLPIKVAVARCNKGRRG